MTRSANPTQASGDPTAGPAPGPAFGLHDQLPDFVLPDQDGRAVRIAWEMNGKKLLLLFCRDPAVPQTASICRELAAGWSSLDPQVDAFLITAAGPAQNQAFLDGTPLPFRLLSDPRWEVARRLGLDGSGARAPDRGGIALVLTAENRRIARIERAWGGQDPVASLAADLESLPRLPPRSLGHFAPVLYVPDVLEPELCRELMAAYDSGRPEIGRAYQHDGRQGEHVIDRDWKIRRDLPISDRTLLDRLGLRMLRRVVPEIARAFTRQVSGVEEFKVVCYDGAEGGHFRAHRDNHSQHQAHRRFAMTLNLNTEDYEGGALRFPEYGPDLYRPESGDAVVFSCSLLHEALPVTRGRRYVLLSFMFDEESRRLNSRFQRPGSGPPPGQTPQA